MISVCLLSECLAFCPLMITVEYTSPSFPPPTRHFRELDAEQDAAHSRALAEQYQSRASTSRVCQRLEEMEDSWSRIFILNASVGIFKVKVPVSYKPSVLLIFLIRIS